MPIYQQTTMPWMRLKRLPEECMLTHPHSTLPVALSPRQPLPPSTALLPHPSRSVLLPLCFPRPIFSPIHAHFISLSHLPHPYPSFAVSRSTLMRSKGDKAFSAGSTIGKNTNFGKKFVKCCCSSKNLEVHREQNQDLLQHKENVYHRRLLVSLISSCLLPVLSSSGKTKANNPYDEKRLLEQNRRVQKENNAPGDFPNFVREGFEVKVVTSDNYVKRDSGLIYWDIEVGKGDCPKAGQQVIFHYIGYNESGRRIDSTYLQGSPARIRMDTNALVPGFEEGIRDMRPGGKRRIIIPPELGPPVGPSTFFSSKQFEVFDVELVGVKDCQRRTIAFYSDVVCD